MTRHICTWKHESARHATHHFEVSAPRVQHWGDLEANWDVQRRSEQEPETRTKIWTNCFVNASYSKSLDACQPVVVLQVEREGLGFLLGVRLRTTSRLCVANHEELLVDVDCRVLLVLKTEMIYKETETVKMIVKVSKCKYRKPRRLTLRNTITRTCTLSSYTTALAPVSDLVS